MKKITKIHGNDTTKWAVQQYDDRTKEWTWLAVWVSEAEATKIAKQINEDPTNPHIVARKRPIED